LLLACHTNCQGTFEHLDALVLSNVYVQWDPTAGIESHFQLEELAVSVAAGLKDGYVLAGEHVMQMITGGHEASLASERVRRQAGMVPSRVVSRSRTNYVPRSRGQRPSATLASAAGMMMVVSKVRQATDRQVVRSQLVEPAGYMSTPFTISSNTRSFTENDFFSSIKSPTPTATATG
jgi:hypothetical protein